MTDFNRVFIDTVPMYLHIAMGNWNMWIILKDLSNI